MNTELEPIKLTKAALNKFIQWSKTRYNDYLGFGTKSENVNKVFEALVKGDYKGEKVFKIECASPVGESGPVGNKHHGKYWRTKTGGDTYIIDCGNKAIEAYYSKRFIKFL